MSRSYELEPQWSCPPGATILDLLEEKNIPLSHLANALGKSIEFTNQLLVGGKEIDTGIANSVSRVLGATPSFWLRRESQFREDRERLLRKNEGAWLDTLPMLDMARFRWIPELPTSREERLQVAYSFFGVHDLAEWRDVYSATLNRAAFRISAHPNLKMEAVAAWLRRGELFAKEVPTEDWRPQEFSSALVGLRRLTKMKDPSKFVPRLRAECARCGVVVAILKAPSGCGVSGATRFLSPQKALIQLSARYLKDDQFWFSFFHEAAHLLLHGKNVLFIDNDNRETNLGEQEANEFAERVLIPPEHQECFYRLRNRWKEIIRFAHKAGVSPGIVVGQLQHHGVLEQNQGNRLKRSYRWSSEHGEPQIAMYERA